MQIELTEICLFNMFSDSTDSIKNNILKQDEQLTNIESKYDRIELQILESEQKLNSLEKEIIDNVNKYKASSKDSTIPDMKTIPEIVSYINSQYSLLEKTISDIESNSDRTNIEIVKKSLEDLNSQLNKIVESFSPYSNAENEMSQSDMLQQMEEDLSDVVNI